MTRKLTVLCLVLVFAVPASIWSAEDQKEIIQQKGELEQIKKEVDQGRKKLDSLKSSEVGLLKQISGYDQRIASNNKIVNRLTQQLRELQNSIADAESANVENEDNLDRARRRYLGNIRQFYFSAFQQDPDFVDDPNLEMELDTRVTYLTAVAEFDSNKVVESQELLEESRAELSSLSGQKSEVSNLKKKRETSTSLEQRKKEQQEKALSQVRRRRSEEADRVFMLEQAAKEMQDIIDRLEREYAERQGSRHDLGPSVFSTLKGQLSSPCRGKVVVPFGRKVDPITKLKSFSPGIAIDGKAGRTVAAVAAGVVAYRGQLRGYGNFVIINHDDQYFTTYAGLAEIAITERAYVRSGEKLGTAGSDGVVKFELRRGREALDPVEWIRIDSF